MDTKNLEWHLTDHKLGHAAGSFYTVALELMVTPDDNLYTRLDQLVALVAHADHRNLASIKAGLPPGVYDIVAAFYRGRVTANDAFERLAPFLRVLPWFLPRLLPELERAIVEYARSIKPLAKVDNYNDSTL